MAAMQRWGSKTVEQDLFSFDLHSLHTGAGFLQPLRPAD
jgi:hypothetical protein